MAFHYSPKAVTDGLILTLDAGNPKCFTSGQTTCRNLITGGNISGANGTPGSGTHTPDTSNFPVYNSINGGVFDFAGGKGMNCDEDLGSTNAATRCLWFYKSGGNVEYIFDGRNNGGQWLLANYTSKNINWHEQLTYNFSATYNASDSAFINQWHHMVATSDGSGSKLYIDGVEVSAINSASADEDFGKNYRIGTRYTTSNEWTGYMGPIHFYNRVLTAKEVLQNFEASKSRFGL